MCQRRHKSKSCILSKMHKLRRLGSSHGCYSFVKLVGNEMDTRGTPINLDQMSKWNQNSSQKFHLCGARTYRHSEVWRRSWNSCKLFYQRSTWFRTTRLLRFQPVVSCILTERLAPIAISFMEYRESFEYSTWTGTVKQQ